MPGSEVHEISTAESTNDGINTNTKLAFYAEHGCVQQIYSRRGVHTPDGMGEIITQTVQFLLDVRIYTCLLNKPVCFCFCTKTNLLQDFRLVPDNILRRPLLRSGASALFFETHKVTLFLSSRRTFFFFFFACPQRPIAPCAVISPHHLSL